MTVTIYYIGGPWDQHKVVQNEPPIVRTLLVREVPDKLMFLDDAGSRIKIKDHEYFLRTIRDDVLVAVHEDLM